MRNGWDNATVGVVGLGLIGGSWAKAVRPLVKTVYGLDSLDRVREAAEQSGFLDSTWPAPGPWLKSCDLVVLAVPPRMVAEVGAQCLPLMHDGSILTDVCSVKERVGAELAPFLANDRVAFVPGHPLAGREKGGWGASDPGLFRHAPYVLCEPVPAGARGEAARRELERLLTAMGARVRHMSAREHDRLVATVSHLPYVTAVALARLLATVDGEPLVGPGFRDSTRVALSPPDLWADILTANPWLEEMGCRLLDELRVLLSACRDGHGLQELLEQGRRQRESVE